MTMKQPFIAGKEREWRDERANSKQIQQTKYKNKNNTRVRDNETIEA